MKNKWLQVEEMLWNILSEYCGGLCLKCWNLMLCNFEVSWLLYDDMMPYPCCDLE